MGDDPKVNGWALGAAAGKLLMEAARPPFQPTPRQLAFRAHTVACWKKNKVFQHQALDLTANSEEAEKIGIPVWTGPPVTIAEFGRWDNDADFRAWLYEEMLPILEIGGEQRKMVDLLWFQGIAAGMAGMEAWAFRAWEDRRHHENAAGAVPVQGASILEDFLTAANKADAWKMDA